MSSFAPKFTQGNIPEHILKMALTNAVALSVFFVVDLINIYFISLLNQPHLVAAIAYAAALLFFTTSLTIAMVIANSAVVAKLIGQGQQQQAKQASISCYLITLVISCLITLIIYFNATPLLTLIGADGVALDSASTYLKITIFSFPLIALAMQITATLRSLGKAKLGMYCTLAGGVCNVILDPLFIFYFKLNIEGAAIAAMVARSVMLLVAIFYLIVVCGFITRITFSDFIRHTKNITAVAIPASLTQAATPLSHLYITYEMAKFGGSFVAGWAIISRLIPVAFVMLFAMPGAIGPIISQNLGAKQFTRVKTTLNQSLNFIIKYVFVLALTLSLLQEYLVSLFNAGSDTAILIRFFCQYVSVSFIFVAMNLVAMSFLNNVGRPKMATLLNLGKMSLGTIPFVSVGAYYYGAQGILIGQALGSIIFGLTAILLCYRIVTKLEVLS